MKTQRFFQILDEKLKLLEQAQKEVKEIEKRKDDLMRLKKVNKT